MSNIDVFYTDSFFKDYKSANDKYQCFSDSFEIFIKQLKAKVSTAKKREIDKGGWVNIQKSDFNCPKYVFKKQKKFKCECAGGNNPARIIFCIYDHKIYLLAVYFKNKKQDLNSKEYKECCRLMWTINNENKQEEMHMVSTPLIRGILNCN